MNEPTGSTLTQADRDFILMVIRSETGNAFKWGLFVGFLSASILAFLIVHLKVIQPYL